MKTQDWISPTKGLLVGSPIKTQSISQNIEQKKQGNRIMKKALQGHPAQV
jgi:hypothetical protein